MAINHWIFGIASFACGAIVIALEADVRSFGNHQGYAPAQPIAYSHRLHAGELQIDCQYCHYGAQSSRHAGIPSASICMNCHRTVTASYDALLEEKQAAEKEKREPRRIVSNELRKLYDALGLDDEQKPVPGRSARPIEWVRVHQLPDFTYFDHRAHVTRGVACQSCHGPVQAMERVRQENTLLMGWCIECHRASSPDLGVAPGAIGGPRLEKHVSTDCSSCHY
jgi:hypothetical protein